MNNEPNFFQQSISSYEPNIRGLYDMFDNAANDLLKAEGKILIPAFVAGTVKLPARRVEVPA